MALGFVTGRGLSQLGFIFAFLGELLILGCFVDGVAMVLLTGAVPVVFPIACALKIDPVHLGVMPTLAVEMSVVTPPVGPNLFAVSGTSNNPITTVMKGSIAFFFADLATLLIVIFVPATATWLPSVLVETDFKQTKADASALLASFLRAPHLYVQHRLKLGVLDERILTRDREQLLQRILLRRVGTHRTFPLRARVHSPRTITNNAMN